MDTFAFNFLYVDLPRFYTRDTSSKTWKRRKKGGGGEIEGHDIHEAETIGRVYTVSPRQGECFFFLLSILLHTIKGPTSFDAHKAVNGAICETFREACQLQGLLEDDNAWHHTMEEAAVSVTPQSLRFLLAIIITQCNPSDVRTLWLRDKTYLAEDFHQSVPTTDAAENNASVELEDIVLAMGGHHLE